MVFVSLSKLDFRFGQGEKISKDTFETRHGLNLFFYDLDSVKLEFGNYDLITSEVINDPKDLGDKPPQKFWYIVCQKKIK